MLTKNNITRFVIIFGAIAVVTSFAIGYQAYVASRDAALKHIYSRNMDLARTFRDYAESMVPLSSPADVLLKLRSLWTKMDNVYEEGFLCVVDSEGRLTLHSAFPDREGVDVGNNTLHPNAALTLRELVLGKQEYVGPYLSSGGQHQVAAFSYSPELDSVVSVHVPLRDIELRLQQASLPWLIGLMLIGGGLLPFSMWFLHRAYLSAQRKIECINEDLHCEIRERKHAEALLEQYKLHLEEIVASRTHELTVANRELESFSYSVSHDLRTPLRAIDGFSKVLLEDYENNLDDYGKNCLVRVRSRVQHMGRLIDDLLTLARTSRGSMHKSVVDLSQIASHIMTELRGKEPSRVVITHIAPGLTAYGDIGLFESLLVNLLDNAWKYTSKVEKAAIEFNAIEQGGTTVFFIKDNGVGFNMQYAHKVFGVFERLHCANEYSGTGIGLATVQRIVDRHGGKIWVQAAPGKGAAFFFSLPPKLPSTKQVASKKYACV